MKRPAPPVQQRLDVGNRDGAADTAFWKTRVCVLGPWPREDQSLALASKFFVSLAMASSLVSSTPPLQQIDMKLLKKNWQI